MTKAFPAFGFGTPTKDDLSFNNARSLAGALVAVLTASRGLVDGGRLIDLSGLNSHIGLLCAKSLDLDADFGRLMGDELQTVLVHVEGLIEALSKAARGPQGSMTKN